MSDPVLTATSNALAHARARREEEVQPDDLLLGALQSIASLGIAAIGPLNLDLSPYPPVPAPNPSTPGRPRYAPVTAAAFDRASALARTDGEARVRLIHLLAALASSESALMDELMDRHSFDDAGWRAALVAWERATSNGRHTGPSSGKVLSVDDAAAALGVHAQTIRGYIRSGKLAAYRIAGERAIRVFETDLYALLEPIEPGSSGDED